MFSKIDVNGDGEAALGVPRGGVTGGVPRVPRGEGRRGDGGTKGPLLATSSACLRPGHRAGFWGCLHQTGLWLLGQPQSQPLPPALVLSPLQDCSSGPQTADVNTSCP